METRENQTRPWHITILAVGGLLGAIIIAGLVGLWLNHRVWQASDEGLRYDVELEDHGDDLRTAVLDVRHYHRNLFFQVQTEAGITRGGTADFEQAYELLHQEIDELEELGVRDPETPQPEDFRRMAEGYYADFRPAIDRAESDPEGFNEASDQGLVRIDQMEAAAQEVDKLGERLSANSFQRVEQTATTSRYILFAVIGGLLLAGAVLAYLAVRVVSELRRLYANQQAAAEKLAEASQAKTDFLADVSHELRTPLTVLRGNAEVGLALSKGNSDHAEILEEIVEESGKMSRMVEDLLFLARSDSASLPLAFQRADAELFLAEVAGRAEILARERGAKLETRLRGTGQLRLDPTRMEQAILILVDNAAKYGAPEGGRITLASASGSGELYIEVEDRGPGIPEKELPRVFERFYRVDKARSRKEGGTGLGLSIAQTIVQAHGGRIEAKSLAGEGTRMAIYLPLLPGSPRERVFSGEPGRGAQAVIGFGRRDDHK